MIEQDSDPRNQDPTRGEVDEPPEDGQSTFRKTHERQEHERAEKQRAHIRRSPGRGSQEDLRRLVLESQTVEDSRAGQQGLIGAGPSRRDDDGVDERWNTIKSRGAGGDDKRRLRSGAVRVVEAGIVAGHEHADDKHGEDVECCHAHKYPLARLWDRHTRISRLRRRHGETLCPGETEHRITHDSPITQKFPPRTRGNEFHKRAGMFPISKADAGGSGDAAEVDDQSQQDQEDDEDDLEQGKPEFYFAVDADEAQADGDGEGDEDDDPEGGVDVGPVLEEDANGGDFGGDGEAVAVDEVISWGDGQPYEKFWDREG